MFDAKYPNNHEIEFHGRLDASQAEKADQVLAPVNSSCTLNFKNLEYISSAGLGILIKHQKRLKEKGHGLKITNLNKHIRDIFLLTGFDKVFIIE